MIRALLIALLCLYGSMASARPDEPHSGGTKNIWAGHPDEGKDMPEWMARSTMLILYGDIRELLALNMTISPPHIRFWKYVSETDRAVCGDCTVGRSQYVVEAHQLWLSDDASFMDGVDAAIQFYQIYQRGIIQDDIHRRFAKGEREFFISMIKERRPSEYWEMFAVPY